MKKAQVHMVETVAILFVFFIMLGFGFILYAKFQGINNKETQTKNRDLESIEVTQRVSFLPELQCSLKGVITDNCIDVLKLDALITKLNDEQIQELYFDLFKYSNITITQIYPTPYPGNRKKQWTLYENIKKDSSSIFIPVPISLYNATTKSYAFGVLEVRFYS
jgi:hypothetical protein